MKDEHPIASAIFILLGIALMVSALNYGFGSFDDPGVGFLSFWAGLSITAFSTITLLSILRHNTPPLKTFWKNTKWQRTVILIASMVVYSVFLRDIGFLPLSFLMMILLLRLLDPSSWKVTLLVALIIALSFYFVFQVWLGAQLPRGFLGV